MTIRVHRGDEKLIRLTDSAKRKVQKLIEKEPESPFLRVRIAGGGCNGLSYKMKFVEGPKDGDIEVEMEGIKVIVDCKSALYIRGTEMDYSSAMIGGGFKFLNPNAKSSCSCGESFSV